MMITIEQAKDLYRRAFEEIVTAYQSRLAWLDDQLKQATAPGMQLTAEDTRASLQQAMAMWQEIGEVFQLFSGTVAIAYRRAAETYSALPAPTEIDGFPELQANSILLRQIAKEQWEASDEIVSAIYALMLLFLAQGGVALASSIAVRTSPGLAEIGQRLPAAVTDLAADQTIGPAWGFMKAFVKLFERAEDRPEPAARWHVAHADLAASFRRNAIFLASLRECIVEADAGLLPFAQTLQ